MTDYLLNLSNHGIYLTLTHCLIVHKDHYIRNTFFSDVSCVNPPRVKNAVIQSERPRYQNGERVRYECIGTYDILGDVDVTCLNGTWTKPPQCKGRVSYSPCPPNLENIITNYIKSKLG